MRLITLMIAVFLATGCVPAGDRLALLQQQPIEGEDFTTHLASEYRSYAESLAERGQYVLADEFAYKGLAALDGMEVLPEEHESLAAEREALMLILTDDVEEAAPEIAARAQALFDCLATEQNHSDTTEALCKESFEAALADLQFVADTLVHGDGNRFAVHFAAGSAALTDRGQKVLDVVARRVSGLGKYKLELVAYGNRPKAGAATRALAAKRLIAIETVLIDKGVGAQYIHSHPASRAGEVFLDMHASGSKRDAVGITLQTFGQPDEVMAP